MALRACDLQSTDHAELEKWGHLNQNGTQNIQIDFLKPLWLESAHIDWVERLEIYILYTFIEAKGWNMRSLSVY